jgi:NAD(P)-dependent dehydrogenase (short-subunit alcohol dehydrogenase family)
MKMKDMAAKKTILITGGSGKIGQRLVEAFLQQGDDVIFTTRSMESVAATLAYFGGREGGQPSGLAIDLCEVDAAKKLMQALGPRAGQVYGIVNNARDRDNLALSQLLVPSREQWMREYTMAVVTSHDLIWSLAQVPGSMLRRAVNVGSIYGVVATNPALYENEAQRAPIHYGVAKAALVHLTKELAVRLASLGITVNAVSYGGVEGRMDPAFLERYAKLAPNGRMLREEELAGTVQYLMSEAAESVTGQNLVVDGGWTLW